MSKEAIVVSRGFHSPWNMGEVVLARNFTKVLMRLYGDINVFSTIDEKRGCIDTSNAEMCGFKVKFFHNKDELRSALVSKLNYKPQVDVHFINAPLAKFLNIVRRARKVYLYQFAYSILNDSRVITRSLGALPLTYLSKISIITTSFKSYKHLSKLFRRRYYYIPAPIDIYAATHVESCRTNYQLRVLYLGHGSYLRLPYDKMLKALSRLHNGGYKIELEAYVSELGYVDYRKFIEGFNRLLEKLNLKHIVKVQLKNLSEREKCEVISKNDVLLYPSLVNAAIDPPVVVLEAMLLGECVIATPVQSIPYILGGNRGIIIDQWSLEDEIYKALKVLAVEPKLLRDYATNSRHWVTEVHGVDAVCERMKSIIMC